MYVNVHGDVYECEPEDTTVFCGDTMIQGVYIDMDDDYLFLPEEVTENYDEVVSAMIMEGAKAIDLVYYDPEEEPFCYIINAMCRLFAQEVSVCLDHEDD